MLITTPDTDQLNSLNELATSPHLVHAARFVGVNSDIIDHYKQTAEEKRESSCKLLNTSVPERGASEVLSQVYAGGYKKQFGWQGVLDVLRDSHIDYLWEALNQALDCVCYNITTSSHHHVS